MFTVVDELEKFSSHPLVLKEIKPKRKNKLLNAVDDESYEKSLKINGLRGMYVIRKLLLAAYKALYHMSRMAIFAFVVKIAHFSSKELVNRYPHFFTFILLFNSVYVFFFFFFFFFFGGGGGGGGR